MPRLVSAWQAAEAGDGRGCLAGARQVPAQKFAPVAIDVQRRVALGRPPSDDVFQWSTHCYVSIRVA
ncbi:hypothetical protein [Gemmobacter aquaticus]|uniref:hypothetical protein n=1 Tax=Gemmobacter aquaticus TaxID=490185 RepID=UPI0013153879|nr:hypothetical protein [Gemmobacter aquaticus]